MLARIVENWLTSAGERGYEAAFSQLLVSEGYKVLHAPVHHPFEHGKDIVAYSPEGALHAFQLKGGDVGLTELRAIQEQLLTLATTAVRYPGVEPPRLPDRAFLVTNGRLSAPARDHLAARNDAARGLGGVPVESIEREQLVGRFVAAHGDFMPRELENLQALLRFTVESGLGPFPLLDHCSLMKSTLTAPPEGGARQVERAIAAATIATSYIVAPWARAENHLAVAEAWLTTAQSILWLAEYKDLEEATWAPAFELARDSARSSLLSMLEEACGAEDLIVPDVVDGVVYPARAALICAYASALLISESIVSDAAGLEEQVKSLLQRELKYVRGFGEASAGQVLLIATALDKLGMVAESAQLATHWAFDLTRRNAPGSESAIPDPYHLLPELMLHTVGAETDLDQEDFDGQAYTLHVFVEWLARRGLRPVVEVLWPDATRLQLCEFKVSAACHLLTHEDPDGVTHAWAPPAPQSWAELADAAGSVDEAALPARLWQRIEMLPYLPLLLPYRLTADVARALDYVAVERCEVKLEDDGNGGEHNGG